MKYLVESGNTPMDIGLEITSKTGNNTIKTVVYNAENKDLILERVDNISDRKKVILKLPMTSQKIIIELFTKQNGRQPLGKDQTFSVSTPVIMPLKRTQVDLGSGDIEFVNFIKQMMVELPRLTPDGNMRKSPSGRFKVVITDKLKSSGGAYINSPAMVGKKTGTIEISKDYMMRLSQNQRVAILCHEYGHFYKNPLSNLPIGDEVGADLNGITVFVGNGFGLDEYGNAFGKVFNGAQTDQNEKRGRVMKMFLEELEKGKYFSPPYNL